MQPNWNPQVIEVPITVQIAGAYDAGDVVGGTLTSNQITQIKGGGYIQSVRLVDDDDEKAAFTLYVYSDTPSVIADGAAFAPTEADWILTMGAIAIAAADYDASGADACAFVAGNDQKTGQEIFFPNLPDGYLYFRLVCTATPTYTAVDDLTLLITVLTT